MAGRSSTASVQSAAAALATGGLVVVVDDVDRENEADLVGAAELMSPEQMAFLVRHTTGIVCAISNNPTKSDGLEGRGLEIVGMG